MVVGGTRIIIDDRTGDSHNATIGYIRRMRICTLLGWFIS
jgi:hypothetical protein